VINKPAHHAHAYGQPCNLLAIPTINKPGRRPTQA
jgi:hypothetical protein